MKKVVILKDKETGEETPYATVVQLCMNAPKDKIGIGKGALWNALSRGRGKFENKRVRIYYKFFQHKPLTWE